MWKLLALVASMALAVSALGEEEKWNSFKTKFGRSYSSLLEDQARYATFRVNLEKIASHNAKYENGLVSYKMGVNKFADLTVEEFAQRLGLKVGPQTNKTFSLQADDVPEEINWVDLGAVTPVKDQGQCGSCWSFSATGAIEAQYFIAHNQLVSLSEQNLVDCTSSYGDYGCNGGLMDYAFKYVCDNGIMSESDYPYLGIDSTCNFDSSKAVVKVKSFVDVTSGSEPELQAAVGTVGPVSIAVDALGFQHYEEGVFDNDACLNSRLSLNHGILAVGYGTDNGQEYWLVKNSWGADWGEKGFIRMSRNKENQCGVATAASYPVL
ncbi:procathepsin L-like [Dendroctonus ponderosae]|uniref:procathepsin L-like n=1 Tax=Dendroctonus ponderosae TaxID=77166 RepID=UPI0020351B82|nr:procathepsin L-like [Dendroctonus ponderosae]KAH1028161.1 hypothetical protein HUJ05_001543 [Dendroctonus ponderosae]